MRKIIFILALVIIALGANAQTAPYNYATFYPTNRQAQWQGNVGKQGGIPNTFSYNVYGAAFGIVADGVTDNTQALTNLSYSLRNSNLTVLGAIHLFPTLGGTIYHASSWSIPYGPGQARPQVEVIGDAGPHLCIEALPSSGAGFTLVGGSYTKITLQITNLLVQGATNVIVNNASSLSGYPGAEVQVTQSNDTNFTSIQEDNILDGNNTGAGQAGTNCFGSVHICTGTQGTTNIYIWPPIPYGYTNSPVLQACITPITNCGIAGIQYIRTSPTDTSPSYMVSITEGIGCWVTNCAFINETYEGVDIRAGMWNTIQHNYFYNALSTKAGRAYSIDLFGGDSGGLSGGQMNGWNLIIDNAIDTAQFAIATESPATANVFAYNFLTNTTIGQSGMSNYLNSSYNTHEAHAAFNLFEGNNTQTVGHDSVRGSDSHDTDYRNYIVGKSYIYPQSLSTINQDMLIEYPSAPWYPNWPGGYVSDLGGSAGFYFMRYNMLSRSNNAIGNIFSTNILTYATQSSTVALWTNTAPGTNFNLANNQIPMCIRIGYAQDNTGQPGGNAGGIAGQNGTNVIISTFVSGNWDAVNNGQTFASGWPTGLSNSLAFASEPVWYGTNTTYGKTYQWPPFNPATFTASQAPNRIPAEDLWGEWNNPVVTPPTLYIPFHSP